MTAGQWFMLSGSLMFLFGLGLIVLLIANARIARARQAAQRPVRTINRIRLHEVSLDPRPGPYGQHTGAAGFTVVADSYAAPPRTARPVPARTTIMPHIPRHDGRNHR